MSLSPVDKYFESSRLKLHYVVWGTDRLPPLVLVHGGRDHARSWDFVAERLADRFCVYALDLRGHGDSDWAPGSQYRISDHVLDLATFVEAISPDAPVSIVGHSMGGRIVLDYAGTFPDRITGLTAIEGFGWGASPERAVAERMQAYIESAWDLSDREIRSYADLDEATARVNDANKRLTPEMARHLAEHAVRRNEDGRYVWKFDNWVHLHRLPDCSHEETRTLWRRIDCPVLLFWGGESDLKLPFRDDLEPALTHASTITVPDAGHWVHHDKLDDFVQTLRGFLGV